ncbi:MAG: undecaprenyl-phosphate glucose phosphotransferase [Rhodospirillaceae bacterium]
MFAIPTTFAADAQRLIVVGLRLADVLAVVGAGIAAYWTRHGTLAIPDIYWSAMGLAGLLTAIYMHFANSYSFGSIVAFSLQFGKVTMLWGAVFVTLIALAYFAGISDSYSRVWVVTWFTTTLIAFGCLRILLALQVESWAKRGDLDINVAIVGAGDFGHNLIRGLENRNTKGLRIVGVFESRKAQVPAEIEGYPYRGDIDDLLRYMRTHRVDEIIVAMPWRRVAEIRDVTDRLRTVAADVKLCPEEISLELPNLGYGEVAGIPMLKLSERPLSGWSLFAKAIEDRVLASLILIAFAPVLISAALAIKLTSRGPVFFRQTRYGFNNNEFVVLKFRTMRDDGSGTDPSAVEQAARNDPRVTAVGRFLRRTSLDELPQLFNVIRGEMSLVGPRPHAVAHNVEYSTVIDEYLSRHRMKPGITGWAQVNGLRGETRTLDLMRQRVQYDLYYIENWSVLFDLRILLMTLFVGFVHRNAY